MRLRHRLFYCWLGGVKDHTLNDPSLFAFVLRKFPLIISIDWRLGFLFLSSCTHTYASTKSPIASIGPSRLFLNSAVTVPKFLGTDCGF